MFFPRKKAQAHTEEMLSAQMQAVQEPRIAIAAGSDLEIQVKMNRLTADDLKVLKVLQPLVNQHIVELVNHFYYNMEN